MGASIASATQAEPKQRLWRSKAFLPLLELAIAFAAAGLWYAAGEGLWPRQGGLGAWPILLLALLWGLRWATTGLQNELSAFSVPIALFLLSAAIGIWAAYNLNLAWAGFWSIVSAVGVYWAISHQPDLRHLYIALTMLGLLVPGLTLYFLGSNVWDQYPIKVPFLFDAEVSLAQFLPKINSHPVHPNIVGGTLATLLPLYVPLAVLLWRSNISGRWPQGVARAGWVIGGSLGMLGLLLSVSRGAWMALGGVVGLWVLWRRLGQIGERRVSSPDEVWRWRVKVMAVLVIMAAALAVVVAGALLLGNLLGSGALRNRVPLLQSALLLARDYIPIGAGPGTFNMQFSIYTLLIHVGHTTHSHNLLADLAIEQGLLGLVSYLWLVAVAVSYTLYWHKRATPAVAWLLEAGLAVLGVQLLHGLVDDIQYGSRVFMLLPFGLILAASRLVPRGGSAVTRQAIRRDGRPWIIGGALLLAVLLVICWRPLVAQIYANLGAIEQSKVELGSYDPARFNERPLESVRREEDLDRALALLAKAVQLDPLQVTARQRLAAIFLARGAYAQARELMETVWLHGHRDSVTRLLLGDALAATGDVERAAEIVRGLTWAQPRLLDEGWNYYEREHWPQAYSAWQTVLLLAPDNEYAIYWSAETKKHLDQ